MPATARSAAAKSAAKSTSPDADAAASAESKAEIDAAQEIDRRIAELADWRGETLARIRALMKEALPDVVEEWKWRVPVWSRQGQICTGEAYKQAVKMTFAKGAQLKDPAGLFNSSLEGNVRRAIDVREGEALNGPALKALFQEAAALNAATARKPAAKKSAKATAPAPAPGRKTPGSKAGA